MTGTGRGRGGGHYRDGEATIAPRVQATGKRPHMLESFAAQRQSNARTGEFARTSAVDDDMAIGRHRRSHGPDVPYKMIRIDSHGAGNSMEHLIGCSRPPHIQNQDVVARAQFLLKLFKGDSRQSEFMDEAEQTDDFKNNEEAERCG